MSCSTRTTISQVWEYRPRVYGDVADPTVSNLTGGDSHHIWLWLWVVDSRIPSSVVPVDIHPASRQ
jgi:hypothetical protein